MNDAGQEDVFGPALFSSATVFCLFICMQYKESTGTLAEKLGAGYLFENNLPAHPPIKIRWSLPHLLIFVILLHEVYV